MLVKKEHRLILGVIVCLSTLVFIATRLYSEKTDYTLLTLDTISNYRDNRIVYQHIQADPPKGVISETDTSVAALLIIHDGVMTLLAEGYDNPEVALSQKKIFEIENRHITNDDVWPNRIDSKEPAPIPDYVRQSERRIDIVNIDSSTIPKEGKNTIPKNYVESKYKQTFLQVRKLFLEKHIAIFRELMSNREDSDLFVQREALKKDLFTPAVMDASKFCTKVYAKSNTGTIYHAEDCDGDNITETFSVHIPDGFNWGRNSGPNTIFIYKNKDPEIQELIGSLAYEALYGSTKDTEERIKEVNKRISQRRTKPIDITKPDDLKELVEDAVKFSK